ncbi:MAG: ATP-binding cassette domain-containing protein [Cyanobacteria bacterium]|jgi:ABC-type multidrug transport system fused ATPase/permease subunit|nr:ATP-binding cassette domain-containing protein [Cyanobacteria bacterium GSL.Bin21]
MFKNISKLFRFISKLLYILEYQKKTLTFALISIVILSILETIGIGLVGPFMSLVSSENSIERNQLLSYIYSSLNLVSRNQFIGILGLLIIVLFYVKSFLRYYIQSYIFRFGYNQQGNLRLRLLRTYLALPYSFHIRGNSAHFVQNILNETHTFCNGTLIASLNTTVHLLVVSTLIVLLVLTDPIATVFILGIVLVIFVIYQQFRKRLANWGKDMSESQTEMIQAVNHSLGSLKETRVIGCEVYFIDQLKKQAIKYAIAMSSALSFKVLPLVIIESLIITFLIGFASLFLILGRNLENLIPVLSVFALVSIRIIPSINQIVAGMSGIQASNYSFNKLYYDLKELDKFAHTSRSELAKIIPQTNQQYSIAFQEKIVLQDIFYCYPSSIQNALNKINLTVKKGDSIAFIGKSGAGKTTLVDVILGLLIPEKGDILVDNWSIYEDIRSWQNLIGYIPQSIFLMDDTLEKNIAFGVPDHLIDSARLNRAIETAQLSNLIPQLPDGLQTRVGERGVCLSGGQQQRVGIARAIYHEREILVFDEATAALDNETESLVTEAIKALSGQKTMITIAHRLSTVEHCDCIYLMDNGYITKSGSYAEVVLNQYSEV